MSIFALFHFIRPSWLWALIPWLLISIFLLKRKLRGGNWANVCDAALLPYILEQKTVSQSRMPLISMSLAALLSIFALAGPTWERIPAPAFRNESGLVIALDLSTTMQAEDIKPSRLIRARYKIEDILKQRKDGQTALLVYSGDAFTVTPLTNDSATIISQLQVLTPDIMPSEGNNTALAVEKAVELLKQAGLQKGQILLVTDEMNADEKSDVLKKLQSYQLSVLAVGTAQGAPISLPDGGFLKDEAGAIVMPKLPGALLQNLAQAGNGIYQEITDDDSDTKAILAFINKAVQNFNAGADDPKDNPVLEKWDEKGVWLLLLILPLAALNFRRGLLSLAFIFLLPIPKNSYAYEWQDLWQTKDQQAYSAYRHGNYEKAAKLFQDPAWQAAAQYKSSQSETPPLKTPTSATGFYNQGNVLAKTGKYEEAIKAYEQALKQNPDKSLKDDAIYNKKLVEDALKKQQQQNQNSQDNQDNKKQDSSENKNSQNNEKQEKSEKKSPDDKSANQNQPQNKDGKENQKNQEQPQQADKNQESPENKPQQSQQKNQNQNQKLQNLQNQQPMTAQEKNELPEKSQEQIQAQAVKQQEDEKKQADEQWLNRIPDDPAGLLRRKFLYQYRQRQRQ